MKKQYLNIYKSRRIKSGLNRPEASKLLGVSERTLDDYESFDFETGSGRRPPDDVVTHMAQLYGSETLIDRHIYENTEAGRTRNIAVKDVPPAEALVWFQVERSDVDGLESIIRKIVVGDELSTNEERIIGKFARALEQMISSSMSLLCSLEGWLEKKEIKINERGRKFGKRLHAWG